MQLARVAEPLRWGTSKKHITYMQAAATVQRLLGGLLLQTPAELFHQPSSLLCISSLGVLGCRRTLCCTHRATHKQR